jgi:Nuclease-related domain
MAYLCPNDLTALALSGGQRAELATLDALKRGLSSAYTIFHNVHWTRESARTTAFGEIDFVVVNRAGEVLVIEQKSGSLQETDQGLIKRYDDGRLVNPIDQLHRSIDAIRGKFAYQNRGRGLVIDYLVYYPHHRLSRVIAPGLDTSRVVDAVDVDRLPERIAALLPPGSEAEAALGDHIRDFFAHAFDLIPDIHAHDLAQGRSFIRLTGGLLRFIDAIEMKPLRLRIRGTAGSGKTVIAAHMFERARDEGATAARLLHPPARRSPSC